MTGKEFSVLYNNVEFQNENVVGESIGHLEIKNNKANGLIKKDYLFSIINLKEILKSKKVKYNLINLKNVFLQLNEYTDDIQGNYYVDKVALKNVTFKNIAGSYIYIENSELQYDGVNEGKIKEKNIESFENKTLLLY